MSDADALDRLAACAGIEPFYYDVGGACHVLAAETKRAFLAAMRIPATTDEQVERSLAMIDGKPWRRALAPVTVLGEDDAEKIVRIVLDAEHADLSVSWTIKAESGHRYEGSFRPADLPLAEARNLDGSELECRLLDVPGTLSPGYYRFEAAGAALPGSGRDDALLIVAPARAYLPDALDHGPGLWGLSLQLYGLQGRGSWGMGDFSTLSSFAPSAAGLGAGALGLNPLHALFLGNPAHASPYSPSSRRFLNPLYIGIEAVPDFAECASAVDRTRDPAFETDLSALRQAPLVDYPGVAVRKLPLFEQLFAAFRMNHLQTGSARAEAFRAFQRREGTALARFARFEALAEHFRGGATGHFPWADWPAQYRDPDSPEVAAFARDRADRVEFYQYLQWEADRQLGLAQAGCAERGMPVGLYRDLALGVDRHGADSWADQRVLAAGISSGAPPDPFNLKGQDWGLPPFDPIALRDAGYRPFIECLRANMRHAGALRIDHVMGFARLFWILEGRPAAEGGYVRYPLEDLLAIARLESQRARCAVVGEDLGTVPEGLRERLGAAGVLSTRLLYFERNGDDGFRPAQTYPALAHVAIGTHDLPSFAAYWRERDIDLSASLDLFPTPDDEAGLRRDRARARDALLAILRESGLLPRTDGPPAGWEGDVEGLVDAAYRFLATSPGRLLVVSPEDVLGVEDRINLPGTVDEYPNWRRKLPVSSEELAANSRLMRLAQALTTLRPPPKPSM